MLRALVGRTDVQWCDVPNAWIMDAFAMYGTVFSTNEWVQEQKRLHGYRPLPKIYDMAMVAARHKNIAFLADWQYLFGQGHDGDVDTEINCLLILMREGNTEWSPLFINRPTPGWHDVPNSVWWCRGLAALAFVWYGLDVYSVKRVSGGLEWPIQADVMDSLRPLLTDTQKRLLANVNDTEYYTTREPWLYY